MPALVFVLSFIFVYTENPCSVITLAFCEFDVYVSQLFIVHHNNTKICIALELVYSYIVILLYIHYVYSWNFVRNKACEDFMDLI